MKRETVESICFGMFIVSIFAMYMLFGALDGGASLWCGLWLIPIAVVMGISALWLEYDAYLRSNKRRKR